jgi:hypothetical protein
MKKAEKKLADFRQQYAAFMNVFELQKDAAEKTMAAMQIIGQEVKKNVGINQAAKSPPPAPQDTTEKRSLSEESSSQNLRRKRRVEIDWPKEK